MQKVTALAHRRFRLSSPGAGPEDSRIRRVRRNGGSVRWGSAAESGFFGLAAGYLLAVWLNQWIWLEMRANVDMVLPAGAFLGAAAGAWRRKAPAWRWLLLVEGAWLLSFLWAYGGSASALAFIPAEELREGCFPDWIGTGAVNAFLVAVAAAGNAASGGLLRYRNS